jgi:hypothetical protein
MYLDADSFLVMPSLIVRSAPTKRSGLDPQIQQRLERFQVRMGGNNSFSANLKLACFGR